MLVECGAKVSLGKRWEPGGKTIYLASSSPCTCCSWAGCMGGRKGRFNALTAIMVRIPWVVLCGMIEWYGSDAFFETMAQIVRMPLEAFEKITIRGNQLASFLYFTDGIEEEQEDS